MPGPLANSWLCDLALPFLLIYTLLWKTAQGSCRIRLIVYCTERSYPQRAAFCMHKSLQHRCQPPLPSSITGKAAAARFRFFHGHNTTPQRMNPPVLPRSLNHCPFPPFQGLARVHASTRPRNCVEWEHRAHFSCARVSTPLHASSCLRHSKSKAVQSVCVTLRHTS